MVRRTRSDVVNYFKSDTENQGLVFPDVQDPRKITYTFSGEMEQVFNQTIRTLLVFRYARYTPLLYYVGQRKPSEFEKQQQRNVGAFMKGILIKRLESSVYAFQKTLDRFVRSYARFIDMFRSGTVYISRAVDVYELIDSDDIDKLEALVAEERAHKYRSPDFTRQFEEDLTHDLELLQQLQTLWQPITFDPKLDTFLGQLKSDATLKGRRLIAFTESKETGEYLFAELNKRYPGKVFFFCSTGGLFGRDSQRYNPAMARDLIKDNFDPNQKTTANAIRMLITTDILAEGMNLHRSNILINYDLPWNPTRVLQRVGRVNRLGSKHNDIYIYNFFPTTQADLHLGLETNITNKIQMFHHILGEDARYLSDGEEIGSQQLFDKLNSKQAFTGEDEGGDSELEYLEMMRKLRDEQPDLFAHIRHLPKKARSGSISPNGVTGLITFFRLGKLKKFYCNTNGHSEEITFFEAARQVACSPETPRAPIPADYYHQLETNKARFQQDTMQEALLEPAVKGGRSNADYIALRLKDRAFRFFEKFTDSDEQFLDGVRHMLNQGTLAKKTAQKVKKEIESILDPLKVLAVLRKHIRTLSREQLPGQGPSPQLREIILSQYHTVD